MGKYSNKSLIVFDDHTCACVDEAPLYSLIQISNDIDGKKRLIILTSLAGFDNTTTVNDMLNTPDNYFGLFTDNLSDSGLNSLSEDTAPTLGGDLNANSLTAFDIATKNIVDNITTQTGVNSTFSLDASLGNFHIVSMDGYSTLLSIDNVVADSYTELYCLFILRDNTIEFGDIEFEDDIRTNGNNNLLVKLITFDGGTNWHGIIMNNNVHEEYTWDISGASYTGLSFDVPAISSIKEINMNPEGTILYILDRNDYFLRAYNLSTPWDVSTAVFWNSRDVSEVGYMDGHFMTETGDRIYIIDNTNMGLRQYHLSTPWDITTMTYIGASTERFQDENPNAQWWKPDGTRVWVSDMHNVLTPNYYVYQYDLTIPWDVTTLTYNGMSLLVYNEDWNRGGRFNPDGTILWFAVGDDYAIWEYNLSDPYNISTAVFNQKYSTYNNPSTSTIGSFYTNVDGTHFIVSNGDTINQYVVDRP